MGLTQNKDKYKDVKFLFASSFCRTSSDERHHYHILLQLLLKQLIWLETISLFITYI